MADASPTADRRRDFDAVFATEKRRLYHLAHLVLRDAHQVETLLPRVMQEAWSGWARPRDATERSAWLTRLCLAECAKHREERPAVPASQLGTAFEDLGSTSRSSGGQPSDEQLDRAYRSLPVQQRAALVLTLHYGYSPAESAELLDSRVGTVAAHVDKAIARLRAELAHG